MSATDPARLREGVEKAKRESLPWEGSCPVDEGGRVYNQGAYREVASTVVGSTADYIVHAANDYPALARTHLELLEAAKEYRDFYGKRGYVANRIRDRLDAALAAGSTTETEDANASS